MVSRQFLVQQSVTDAIAEWFPNTLEAHGIIGAAKVAEFSYLSGYMTQTWSGLCASVRERYSALLTREHLIHNGRTCQK